MNPATEFVHASKSRSPVHEFVADHGQSVNRSDIEHDQIAGRSVTVSKELTEDERELAAEAIEETEPQTKACWANSLKMWKYDSRFRYTDRFAGVFDSTSAVANTRGVCWTVRSSSGRCLVDSLPGV